MESGIRRRCKVKEYSDTGLDENKKIQSSDGPFADEAMAAAREPARSS